MVLPGLVEAWRTYFLGSGTGNFFLTVHPSIVSTQGLFFPRKHEKKLCFSLLLVIILQSVS